ncbi:ABC transporter ATP-binding protein [Craurococcus roseus]|uniref:ABC transporter ATP-binding protein n=1 Tax=Craurococcus roseus TaxID=77585 RepID=A0ABN1F5N1_9PROT
MDGSHFPQAVAANDHGAGIAIRGVHKGFGEKRVLRGIDLDVAPGGFLAIVGRSGCGKSTLLRILAGLETQDAGDVAIDGSAVRPAEAARLMFQEPRLLPWSSVLGNVEVGLGRARKAPGGRAQALERLAEVGLRDRARDWPAVLSGGQKQRVALARALVSRPRLLALDEPLGALDALTRIEMQSLLERVWLEQRFTAVLVTHDVAEAVALADRVVLVEGGAVRLDLPVPLPRPRRRGTPDAAALEARILARLLRDGAGTGERSAA